MFRLYYVISGLPPPPPPLPLSYNASSLHARIALQEVAATRKTRANRRTWPTLETIIANDLRKTSIDRSWTLQLLLNWSITLFCFHLAYRYFLKNFVTHKFYFWLFIICRFSFFSDWYPKFWIWYSFFLKLNGFESVLKRFLSALKRFLSALN